MSNHTQPGIGIDATPEPVYIPLEDRHVDAAKTLWSERFGCDDEYADNWLHQARIDAEYPTQGFVAVDRTKVVGFGLAAVGDAEYASDYAGGEVVGLTCDGPTGILHILVVDADYEGRGIGSELVAARLEWLETTDATSVIGTAWHRADARDSRPLFQKFGFKPVATVDEYYLKTNGRVDCPDCGETCRCDATIYRREL